MRYRDRDTVAAEGACVCVVGGGWRRCVFVHFERVWQEGKIPPKSSRCKLKVLT